MSAPKQLPLFSDSCGNSARYHDIAAKTGTRWVAGIAPKSRSIKTAWECLTCGSIFRATYQAMDTRVRKKSKYTCPKCGIESRASRLRLKRSDYTNGALDRGIKWVGETLPKQNKEKTQWECPEGHIWDAPYHDVVDSKSGCPYCANNTPVTFDDFVAIEKKTGYRWVTRIAVRSHDKTTWECHRCGNIWETTLYLLRIKEHGCPECGKRIAGEKRRISISRYHELAQDRDLTWLGHRKSITTAMPTRWKCNKCNQEFMSTYKYIVDSARGCPYCPTPNVRLRLSHYIAMEQNTGHKWLDREVALSDEKTRWQCGECGHTWEITYRDLKGGYGCPECGKVKVSAALRKTVEDYHNLASKHNAKWVGEHVPDQTKHNTTWECCECGNAYDTTYSSILRSPTNACPYCQNQVNGQRTSSQQRTIADMLGGEMNVFYNPANRKTVDIAIERQGYKVAIEYDGWYWHGHPKQQKRDRHKYNRIVKLGWKLVRICSAQLLPTEDQLETAISDAIKTGYAEVVLDDWGVGSVFDRDVS